MWLKIKQPGWAKRMEKFMAKIEEKLAELEASMVAKSTEISASIDGVVADLKTQSDEIAALKQAVLDGASSPGELSPELTARFDALKTSFDAVAQRLADVDAALPGAPPIAPEVVVEAPAEAPVA